MRGRSAALRIYGDLQVPLPHLSELAGEKSDAKSTIMRTQLKE